MTSTAEDVPPPQQPAPPLVLLPDDVVAELRRLEGDNLEKEQKAVAAFVDQHFQGDLAPREAHRLRSEFVSLLEMLLGQQQQQRRSRAAAVASGTGEVDATTTTTNDNDATTNDNASSSSATSQQLFEGNLKAFDIDFGLLIESTARSLRRLEKS